jgi:hypothetical protein
VNETTNASGALALMEAASKGIRPRMARIPRIRRGRFLIREIKEIRGQKFDRKGMLPTQSTAEAGNRMSTRNGSAHAVIINWTKLILLKNPPILKKHKNP